MKAAAIIVAAGNGRRFGSATPKQFLSLEGLPVFMWSVLAFKKVGAVKQIILVVPEKRIASLRRHAEEHGLDLVPGGAERFDSVRRGLEKVRRGMGYVAIHDAARPLISPALIRKALQAAHQHGASLIAVPARDTVKISGDTAWVGKTLPRTTVWLAQTPQVFRRRFLERAYERGSGNDITDDAQMIERLGKRVRLVPGDYRNIKLTERNDLAVVKIFLKQQKTSRKRTACISA